MPTEDRASCELIQDTFRVWERLYRKVPSPFVMQDLSESYWGRNSWPLLMNFLDDQDNMFMLDGEKMGIDSSKRRNQLRQHTTDSKTRKLVGRKLDLIARDMQEKMDWLVVERMNKWDETSNKFLKESNCDLFRETHTIMSARLKDTKNSRFKDKARFFGIYTGDRGFRSFELRPAGVGSYISIYKEFPVYDLPASASDMRGHIQGVAHLLQLRMAMVNTIEAYHEMELPMEYQGTDWIYENSRGDHAEVTIASSPVASPPATDIMSFASPSPSLDPIETLGEEDIVDRLLYD
ncbi:hypothetical protein BGZ94_000969 [Podila epigama]|nr:hypothetical protein BGZ94_000969 [Podila epigama]